MNIKRYITKEHLIFTALLLFVTAVVIYAPLHYHFNYPIGGHDAAIHIQRLADLTKNTNIGGTNFSYYGILLLLPFSTLGINPITVISVFYYLTIIAVFVSMWVMVRRFYGFLPAVLSFPVSVFMAFGIWKNFDDGMVFNILNLWVIAPFAFSALCFWLESGKHKWLAITGVLFIATSLIHNATYLFIMVAMGVFTGGAVTFYWRQQNREKLKRVLAFVGVFLLSVASAWFTWMHTLLPRLTKLAVDSVVTGEPSQYEWITFSIWFNQHLNPGTALLLLAAAVMLVAIFKTGTTNEKSIIINRLNQPISYIILSFLPFLTIGTFTLLGYDYGRFARDQITFIGLVIAVLLGLALENHRFKSRKIWIITIALVFVVFCTPVRNWLGDYTALRPCDEQAIDYLNKLPSDVVRVQHFSKLAPWMYELYTLDEVEFVRAYNLEDISDGDYILYRNSHMTHYTQHVSKPDDIDISPEIISQQSSIAELVRFPSGEDIVIIYKVKTP